MIRNAIQMLERVGELCDIAKTTRRSDREYMNVLNEATELVITKRIDPLKTKEKYSVQSAQRVRDELTPLIPAPATGTPVSDLVPFPADYKSYLLLYVTVGTTKLFCAPTGYNYEGETIEDPFSKPADDQLYFNERATGLRIFHGPTALGVYEFWYIRNPNVISIGQERDKLVAGATLTNAVVYYVYDESVYSGATYYPGETITGTGAVLTSGTVIIGTKIVSSELPSALQDEICNIASAILAGTVEDYYKKQSLNQDADKY